MINITVLSYNNQAPASALSASFGAEGRTLGRGADNHFVLDDPRNLVSRTQALVKSDGARHTIVNLSHANPILVNGNEIDAEREYDLRVGDEIQIGLYLLRAEAPRNPTFPRQAPVAQLTPGSLSHAGSSSPLPGAVALSSQSASADRKAGENTVALALAPASAASAASREPVDHQALVQAFLKGAGIPSVTLAQGLSPELMEMIGRLLAISVQGAMDLSALRALVKREVNADVTVVVVRNNNPLKFLPDAETVLTQMFRKRMPGFMSPTEAMEDAYEDLHAHQLGVVAGMRAAMADMLKRFDPDAMGKRIKDQSFLGSVLPVNRKVKLWDSYTEIFRKINAESQDDFQMIFGQAFLDAYEKEVERVKNENENGR